MEEAYIKILVEETMRKKIDKDMSVEELVSLSRLLHIVYDFHANSYVFPDGNAWQNKDRDLIFGKLTQLYDECALRISKNQAPEVTAALLPAMFDFVRLPLQPLDNRKFQECDDMAVDFLENISLAQLTGDWKIEHSSMRIIIELSEQMLPEERDKDELCRRLETKMSEWAKAMNADGSWNGVSDLEALSRLEVMNRNSYMTLENRFNSQVSLGYRHYKNTSTSDPRGLFLLVELSPNLDNEPADLQTIDKIKGIAQESLSGANVDSAKLQMWHALWLTAVFYLSWC